MKPSSIKRAKVQRQRAGVSQWNFHAETAAGAGVIEGEACETACMRSGILGALRDLSPCGSGTARRALALPTLCPGVDCLSERDLERAALGTAFFSAAQVISALETPPAALAPPHAPAANGPPRDRPCREWQQRPERTAYGAAPFAGEAEGIFLVSRQEELPSPREHGCAGYGQQVAQTLSIFR